MTSAQHTPGARRHRPWLYGAGLMAAALVLAIVPAATRAAAAWRALRNATTTHAVKLAWVEHHPEIEKRVEEREAEAAALDEQLVTAAKLAEIREAIMLAARASGCIVHTTSPLEPKTIPRPEEDSSKPGARPAARTAKEPPRASFVQWPIHVVVQGEYMQVVAMLGRLRAERACLRITKLSIHPTREPESLTCSIELSGYGLRAPAAKPKPSKGV